MTPGSEPDPPRGPDLGEGRTRRGPLLLLTAAVAWAALVRVPLLLNASEHLDSDLAVDGLTLIDALQGDWRWHYPGTPHIGIPPVLLSMPAALMFGATPAALVSGGLVAFGFLQVATFALAWSAFGRRVACWALLPMAFGSVGAVWLSGRITGGHLPAAGWLAVAFLLLAGFVRRGGGLRALGLGLWCGFGFYLDSMVLPGIVGVVAGLAGSRQAVAGSWRGLAAMVLLLTGFAIGGTPRWLIWRADPTSSYEGQFATIFDHPPEKSIDWDVAADLANSHAQILFFDCLPRLVGGRLLSDYRQEPSASMFLGRPSPPPAPGAAGPLAIGWAWGSLGLFGLTMIALIVIPGERIEATDRRTSDASAAVRAGLAVMAILTLAAFVVNLNIYNSDNYRYLVTLLVPWSIGFGLGANRLARSGTIGLAAAATIGAVVAGISSAETVLWYRGIGWLGAEEQAPPEPMLAWLADHPEVSALYGGYWDVYRISFLTGGKVRGVPYPNYPDRFPGLARSFPGGRPPTLLARRDDSIGEFNRRLAISEGAEVLLETPSWTLLNWPPPDRSRRGE